ncbi:MAG: TAXI family TRAP transporter solute-binding subunit, partial [Pseudomonadota bacterium]
ILMAITAAVALWFLSRDLVPPDRVRFASGGEGGGYHGIALAYRDILARDGIEVEVLTTAGSVENARLLTDGSADVGVLQGGVEASPALETLGNLFLEPLFVFTRAQSPIPANPGTWRGLELAVGGEGSGTRAAYRSLSEAAGIPPDSNTLVARGGTAGANALLAGEVDAALFVAPLEAPYLAPLFASDEVRLLGLGYLDALTGRLEQSAHIQLPAGGISLSPVVPRETIEMVAMVARLAAQPDLHPALVDRLVEAARELHSGRTAIHAEGRFPNTDRTSLTADAYARDLIRSGPSPLQDYLPYWVVAQINRFAILLLPIFFLLLPLLRLLPTIYRWRMRARVYSYYQDIRTLETAAHNADPGALGELDAKLARIDEELASLSLPLPYRDYAYTARLHVDLARRKIANRKAG